MKIMTLRLDPEVAELLGIVAAVEHRPISDVIRSAVAEYVENVRVDAALSPRSWAQSRSGNSTNEEATRG